MNGCKRHTEAGRKREDRNKGKVSEGERKGQRQKNREREKERETDAQIDGGWRPRDRAGERVAERARAQLEGGIGRARDKQAKD